MQTVYEGTWDEIAAHRDEFEGRHLKLIVEEKPDEVVSRERLARLDRALAIIEEVGRDKGPYPNHTMDNDFFYPDDEERV